MLVAEPVQGQAQIRIRARRETQSQRAQLPSAIVERQIAAERAPVPAVVRRFHHRAGEKALLAGVDFQTRNAVACPGLENEHHGLILHGVSLRFGLAELPRGGLRALDGERDLVAGGIREPDVDEIRARSVQRLNWQCNLHRTGLGHRQVLPEAVFGGCKGIGPECNSQSDGGKQCDERAAGAHVISSFRRAGSAGTGTRRESRSRPR